ncbi:hypothetical protein KRP22_013607 [Phytophthora ramorum]|nr:hypothetical protein KRP22_11215 [Phytophthora ramorum]
MLWFRDPAPYLPKDLCRAFHAIILDGDIDEMLELVEIEPLLVHARNEDRATSLMIATSHPDPLRAVEMMKMLVQRGAYLGAHDSDRRHSLIYACEHNAGRLVVENLLQWNDQCGGTKFHWYDCDTRGQSALVLASKRANTPVATLLLGKFDIRSYAKQNHPFKTLKVAIDSGNAQHALTIALHESIQASIKTPEITRYKGSGTPTLPWTISTCTEAAIDQGMIDLVQVLNQLNRRKVSRAVWYTIHKLFCDGVHVLTAVPRELLLIGRYFTDAWRWIQVRELCLMRYGCNQDETEAPDRLLPSLPDDVFHRVVAFAVPSAFQHPSDFEKRWFNCDNVNVFGECRWHDCYKATQSDYDRLFNYSGTL